MINRRSTYFIFQALLTVVLLLFFFYRRELVMQEPLRLLALSGITVGILIFLSKAPLTWLGKTWVQGTWFLVDVLLSSITVYWAGQPGSDLYLTYFLVIFGTALTENITHSFLVALVATVLYGYSAVNNAQGLPKDPEFWLRLPYLWIFASFTAMLTRDSRDARKLQADTYQERLLHMERLAVLGQISAEVAHRIKAPLTTIRVNAEVLAYQTDLPKRMQGELIQIQQEVDHCKEVLQKLLDLGRIEEMDMQRMDLQDCLRSALETIRPQLAAQKIRISTVGIDQSAPAQGDPVLLREALLAVLQNAIEAMPTGGDLRVEMHPFKQTAWWPLKQKFQESFEVLITDTGTGVQPEHLETIFRPFFTTKTGHGTGLGLSAALRILDKHGGSIRVESAGVGRGATFSIMLPNQRSA